MATFMEMMSDGMSHTDGTMLYTLKTYIAMQERLAAIPLDGLPAEYQAYRKEEHTVFAPWLEKLKQLAADLESGSVKESEAQAVLEQENADMMRMQEELAARHPGPAADLGGNLPMYEYGRQGEALLTEVTPEVSAQIDAYFEAHPEVLTPHEQMAAMYGILARFLREKAQKM